MLPLHPSLEKGEAGFSAGAVIHAAESRSEPTAILGGWTGWVARIQLASRPPCPRPKLNSWWYTNSCPASFWVSVVLMPRGQEWEDGTSSAGRPQMGGWGLSMETSKGKLARLSKVEAAIKWYPDGVGLSSPYILYKHQGSQEDARHQIGTKLLHFTPAPMPTYLDEGII
ncbi:hypothetical protein DSO57_1020029 [Entomophthora muscae]|uniref:Uncharacterized protein n=1 Tax=Entomophthora muscae TaxID=34485 RepID=A0ACC2RIG6_9FUNG|nr:hypothetical protein DSO57_1020029 [Entomophthora muscae]